MGTRVLRLVRKGIDRRDGYRMVARIAKAAQTPRHSSAHSVPQSAITNGEAFLAAAGAGEVAQATGGLGAPSLSSWADPGQQTVCPAGVTDAVGLARVGEAAGADPALGPVPERDPDTAAWVRRWCRLGSEPQRTVAAGAAQAQ